MQCVICIQNKNLILIFLFISIVIKKLFYYIIQFIKEMFVQKASLTVDKKIQSNIFGAIR